MRYVMGVGNYSMFDDSIGLKIVEAIEEKNLDKNFRAVDLSGNLLNIFCYLDKDTERIIIVDSGEFDLSPGEVCWFTPDLVLSVKELPNISSHEGDIVKVLKLAEQTDYPIPEITIMGIQPEIIKQGFGLSKTLEEKLPDYVEEVVSRILA